VVLVIARVAVGQIDIYARASGQSIFHYLFFLTHNHNLRRMQILAKTEHLIDLQPSWNLVRDEQHRHLPLELVDRPGEEFGGRLIEVGDRFVEDQDLRSLEQRPGDRDALLLAAREAGAAFADLGLVALREVSRSPRESRPPCTRRSHPRSWRAGAPSRRLS
jgi:hypothetical protein